MSDEEEPTERRKTPLELHVNTLITTLVAGGIGWIVFAVIDLKQSISSLPYVYVLKEELYREREQRIQLERDLDKLKASASNSRR